MRTNFCNGILVKDSRKGGKLLADIIGQFNLWSELSHDDFSCVCFEFSA